MGKNNMPNHSKLFEFIAKCSEPEKLRSLIVNARQRSEKSVEEAAFRKLISIIPSEKPGTVEHHLWQTIIAFEEILSGERAKTTRLTRTRQKVARVGVVQTLVDWALSDKSTEGFDMLLARGMPELTGEAIVLMHQQHFGSSVLDAARKRLETANVDVNAMLERTKL
jgi:hypothetical protein